MVTEVNQDQNLDESTGGRNSSASFAKKLATPRNSIPREARRVSSKKKKERKWQ